MLNIITSYITGVITGLDSSSLNLYELEEWFNTYSKVRNAIDFMGVTITGVILYIILYKILYKLWDLIEEALA